MPRFTNELIQRAAGLFGARVVHAPRLLGNDADIRTPERFFPVGRHEPWTIPEELRAREEPWARALVAMYNDPSSWAASLAPELGLLLRALVLNFQPTTILEVGTFMGVSTLWMASALAEPARGAPHEHPRRLYAFDLFGADPRDPATHPAAEDRRRGVESSLRDSGLGELVRIHAGDSAPAIRAMHRTLADAGGVQLAYLDGDHSAKGVTADFLAVEPLIPVGGYVLLHDTFPEVCSVHGPRWLIDNLASVTKSRYQVCELYTAQTNYGLGVLRRMT